MVIVTKRVIFRDGDDVQLDYKYLKMQKNSICSGSILASNSKK